MVLVMARKNAAQDAVTAYLSKIGSKGGAARVSKGIGSLSQSDRKKLSAEALKARWDAYYKAHPEKLKAKKEREAKGTKPRGRPAERVKK